MTLIRGYPSTNTLADYNLLGLNICITLLTYVCGIYLLDQYEITLFNAFMSILFLLEPFFSLSRLTEWSQEDECISINNKEVKLLRSYGLYCLLPLTFIIIDIILMFCSAMAILVWLFTLYIGFISKITSTVQWNNAQMLFLLLLTTMKITSWIANAIVTDSRFDIRKDLKKQNNSVILNNKKSD